LSPAIFSEISPTRSSSDMKYFLVILALACAASAANFRGIQRGTFKNVQLEQLKQRIGKTLVKALLPDLPAKLELDDTTIALDTSLLTGEVTLNNGQVNGLDTLSDTIVLNLLTLTAKGDVNIETVQVTGSYEAQGELNLNEGTFDVKGAGEVDVTIEKIKVKSLSIKIAINLITSKISVSALSLTPSIGAASGGATGATANGQPIDWAAVGSDAPSAVDEFWAKNGVKFTEEIRAIVNELIKDLTLQDIIDIIGGIGGR